MNWLTAVQHTNHLIVGDFNFCIKKDRINQVDHNGKPRLTPAATSTSTTSSKRKPQTTTSSRQGAKRSRTSTIHQGMAGDGGREGRAPYNPTGSSSSSSSTSSPSPPTTNVYAEGSKPVVMFTEAQEVAGGTTSNTSNDSTKNIKNKNK